MIVATAPDPFHPDCLPAEMLASGIMANLCGGNRLATATRSP
jgi:hypothetical protein